MEKIEDNEYTSKEILMEDQIIKVYIDIKKDIKKKVIIKEINLSSLDEEEKNIILKEEFLISQFKHPKIIKCNEFHLNNNKINIEMEYPEGNNLLNKIKENTKFEEKKIINWFIEICEGINYIHYNNIINLNLKSSNIFLTKDNHIKIGIFKSFKLLNNEYQELSPEIIKNEPYDFESDIWNLGIILYELTQLKHPFHDNGNNNEEIKNNIKYEDFSNKNYSDKLLSLIKILLKNNSNERLDINQILFKCYSILFKINSESK